MSDIDIDAARALRAAGRVLVEAAERDGDMSDEEVSGYRGRAEERYGELASLLAERKAGE